MTANAATPEEIQKIWDHLAGSFPQWLTVTEIVVDLKMAPHRASAGLRYLLQGKAVTFHRRERAYGKPGLSPREYTITSITPDDLLAQDLGECSPPQENLPALATVQNNRLKTISVNVLPELLKRLDEKVLLWRFHDRGELVRQAVRHYIGDDHSDAEEA